MLSLGPEATHGLIINGRPRRLREHEGMEQALILGLQPGKVETTIVIFTICRNDIHTTRSRGRSGLCAQVGGDEGFERQANS